MMKYQYNGINRKDKIYLFYLRYLSFHPGKRKLRRFITNRFFPTGIGIISTFDAKFKIKTFDYIDQELIFKGFYEPETLKLCRSLINSDDIFIDVGSNFGLYALNIARSVNLRVIAIEPNPVIFNRLLKNKELNHLDDLKLINVAVGENFKLSGMACPSMNNSGNYQISGIAGDFFVAVIPIQKIFDLFDIKTIKLLKIDVEGFELDVFKGVNWDKIDIQNIVMEFIPKKLNKHNSQSDPCLKFLKEKKYIPYKIDGSPFQYNTNNIPESNLWLKKIH